MKYLWEEGDKMVFPPSIQAHQLPLFAEVLNTYCTFTCWVSGSAALPNKEGALVFATRCQSRVQDQGLDLLRSTNCRWAAWQSKEEACLVAGRRLCLSPGLTGPLLPFSAGNSSVGEYTNGFKWTSEDIAGMKRVFEWILEVRDHSPRGRLCKM